MSMPARKYDIPTNLLYDKASGRYRYRNPITHKYKWIGRDRARAVELAEKANAAHRLIVAQKRLAKARPPTVGDIVSLYEVNVMPKRAWDSSTRKNIQFKLNAIRREFGDKPFETVDRLFLGDWLDVRCTRADSYMKWRALLIEIWDYAIARKIADYNEAAATMRRSVSEKISANRKIRKRLDIAGFRAIHDSAPPFLQTAMRLSLVTLQGRAEIVNFLLADRYDGWLHFIRDKTAGDTEKAFIRIEETPQIAEIIAHAMSDGTHSPFVVHYKPKSRQRKHMDAKPHWTYVTPDHLTKTFKDVRDECGLYDSLKPRQRPTFHEIRSLGARIYEKLGYPKGYINALLGHADEKTTDIYLRMGKDAITHDHYKPAKAEMNLSRLPEL